MPIFVYQGRDKNGQLVEGKHAAQSVDNIYSHLINEGIIPISIEPESTKTDFMQSLKLFFTRKKIKAEDLTFFSRQMYVLTKTGVPITAGIKQLGENARSPVFGHALREVADYLESGQDLASAMNHFPDVFSPLMVSMIRIGQSTGRLDSAFLSLNNYLELETNTRKNAKAAIRYPAFVFFAVISAVVIINIFVIPTFAKTFMQANIPLPAITRGLMTVSSVMSNHWLIMLITVFLLVYGIYYYIKTPAGQLAWGKFQFKIPIVGKILKRIILMRFAQTFAVTVNAGIPVIEGLKLVGDSIGNAYAQKEISLMEDAIQRGNSLTQSARASDLFTPIELQMLAVSEQTGELGSMLEHIGGFYQREVEYDLKTLNTTIEPVLIVILGAVVLLLALAVYLPIWNMVKLAH